ncbi:hypothetical protein P152DRAFT_116627 [Eremomyces bilateralis CBS 781.70]|uniref:SH3 domain-containing protein n=1 Tax=Eremomyces bilateralis CBS 781.70 TaxID=1392243 RepID=A0A6G1GEI8_9PEZI|nr:uncharacterized protein P152DRAFT_116627 [Eremomyces bilateralis CBS 781.70]KAF1816280.1 hypothetical protein P152DRAFT_116627 [Eremomyces bilateralis CBS 781.70]
MTTSAAVLSSTALSSSQSTSSTFSTAQRSIAQASATSTPSAAPVSGGMSGGAKAGLAIGIIALVALIGAAAFFFIRKKKRDQDNSSINEKSGNGHNPFADPPATAAAAPPVAPQLSLRPVTQFQPNLAGARGSNVPPMDMAPAPPAKTTDAQGFLAPNGQPAGGLERSGEPSYANGPGDAQNPFGSHAEMTDAPKPMSGASFNLPIQSPDGTALAAGAAGAIAVGAVGAAAIGASHHNQGSSNTPKPSSVRSVDGALQAPPTPGTPGADSDSSSAAGVPAVATTAAAIPLGALAANGQKPRPIGTVHRVQLDFKPSMEDELGLNAGQLVRVLHEYDDGWALCLLMNGSKQGVVPRSCLSKTPVKPRAGPPPNGPPRGPPPQNMRPGPGPIPGPGAFPHPPSGRNSPGRNSPGPFPGSPGVPRPLTPGSGRNSPGPAPSHRPMTPPGGRPRGRPQSPGLQHMNQHGPRPRANSNAAPFNAYQPRSMSPGPYGGGPAQQRPQMQTDNRRRSNSTSQLAGAAPAPGGPGPSPMNPISIAPPTAAAVPQRKPVPGVAM